MFKLESYISPLLMSYLDKYVKLRQEDFQLSLWGGDAILNNLDLRLDELEKIIQLPVMFQSGHIHELRLHVPWTKLGSEPVVITINTVECILKVRDTAYDGGSTTNSSEANSRPMSQRKRNPEAEALPPGYLQSIISRIVNNVTFVINNLILKFVEDDIVLSVNIKSGECYSVDRDWNRAFVELTQEDLALRKVFNFADLTVCLDKTNASGHIESYQEPMAYRCAVTCRLHMHYEHITSKYPKATRFNVYCDVLNLTLTDTQLPMFVRLIELCMAMYYGTLDIPSANENPTGETASPSSSKTGEDNASALTGEDIDEENQGWASWAWSYVPQILPPEEGEEGLDGEDAGRSKRVRHAPLILSLGFYLHQGNIIFKLTEKAKESSELPHKKMHFHPFLTLGFEGASLEVLIQGLAFCNVQSGISALKLFTCGNCICGVADDNVARCNTLLTGGEPLNQKMSVSYLSNSLFDAMSFENQGHSAQYILDGDQHRQAYTEQYGLQKFGAFWVDYLYTFEKPKKHSGAGSHSSDTDVLNAIFDKEFSTLRFLFGNLHLVYSSTFYHRVSKFLYCMWDHQYEPYGSTISPAPSEERPKPTEEQIMSLEEFIPTQLVHLALINPSAVIITSEHEECDLKKKQYKSKHRKRKNKQEDTPLPNDLACVAIGASRFDLQITKPMYPGRLVKLVSAIAGPSSNLLHHCHKHTQIKLFSIQVGLQRASNDSKMSRPLTLIPPCSFALYSRALLLPKLWNNTSLPIKEWMYEIPNASINMNKASIIMATRILSSWLVPKAKQTVDVLNDSLLDDLFPSSGESTSQTYPLLELSLCGLEFKSCGSSLVDACTGSLSSLQIYLYTPGTGGRMAVIPILCSPAETSQLTNPAFFTQGNTLNETMASDCITATLQKPKNTGIRQAQALTLVDCQGFAFWLDPALMSWFHYCPQPRPNAKSGQSAVTLDMSLAQLTSPLNVLSQASVHSTSSPSHPGHSQAQTSSYTPKQAGDRKSQPAGEDKEKKKDKGMKGGGKDSEKETVSETLARYFPLIRALHVQVDIKSSVIFLPKTGLPTNVEPSSDIVTTVQQASRDGHLSSTLVICLPAILVTSTMTRPMNVLQELPVTDFHESLIGEKLPWTIKLSNTCVYSLFPGQMEPFFLLCPVDIVSTLAINCTYNPPTSEQISGLAFCIHMDVATPHFNLTSSQLHLLSIVSALGSNLSKDALKLYKDCIGMFVSKREPEDTSWRDQSNLRISSSSTTHKLESLISGDVTEQLTTDISEDMSHDASPLHESLIDSDEENGVKLSLWLQLMISKLECEIHHACPRLHKESAVSCVLDAFDLSLDSQSVYSKVKMTLGSISMQHAWKGADGSWCWTDPEGILVSCTRQLPRHIHTVSNKLWLAENTAGMAFAQNHEVMNREKTHGVLSVTLTHALCKNVKRRLRKANVELPVVSEQGGNASSSTSYDPDMLYFHEYLTEICLKVGPVDVVAKAEAIDVIMGLLSGIGKKSQPVRKPPKPQQSPIFVNVPRPQEMKESALASFAVHNLPLLYADVGLLRIFVPLPQCENRQQSSSPNVCDNSSLSAKQATSSTNANFPSSSASTLRSSESSNSAILSQPRAHASGAKDITDTFSRITSEKSPKSNRKDTQTDTKACPSTLDHDMLVVQVSSFVLQPHAENPLPRTPCDKEIFHKATQSGMSYQPGASVEDRQYQLDVRGLALSTGCWDQVMRETKKAELQKSPTGSMVQIPALDWNTFLMDSVGEERKDIKLVPLATAFDTCLVMAPPIFCLPQQDMESPWKTAPHLICGLTMELNLTSDLDLYMSISQLDLLNQLSTHFGKRLSPYPHVGPVSATDASHSSFSKVHDGGNPLQPLSYLSADPSLPSNRGGDSGVESDISTLTLDHGHRVGADRGLNVTAKHTENKLYLSSMGTPFTGSPRADRAEKKINEKADLFSSKSFFDLLVTAGRISCTVYMHKILEDSLTLEIPLFQEKRDSQRVRHQSSYTPKPMGMQVKDNLDQRLKATPRRHHSIGEEKGEEADEENEESSDSNEEEFTEFNFMKQMPSENNLKKTIPEGSSCVVPFVYLYIAQPHCILANHGESQMKAELSCYDVFIKGASDQHLSAVDEYHIIPDCADFNVHWLETRAGQPHPYTGIPPSLLTAQFLREPDKPDTIGLHLDRPFRLKISQLALEQIVAFSKELSSLKLGPSPAKQPEREAKESHPDSDGGKALLDPLASITDKISLSSSQVVVTLEMNENESNVGGTFSLEGFKMDIDLQKTESDYTPIITSNVKNMLVKLTNEKKSCPLVGPVTLSLDACFSWITVSANKVKPQLMLVVDTGIILMTFGQEHVFCLTQLANSFTKLQQKLFGTTKKHTKTEALPSEKTRPKASQKAPSGSLSMSDFAQDHSHDDLRKGGFKFVDELPEGSDIPPEPNEIVFSSSSSSNNNNKDVCFGSSVDGKGGNLSMTSYMAWCYPHPRAITGLHLTPVPFSLTSSTMSLDSSAMSSAPVPCVLQYFDELVGDFEDLVKFYLSENEPVSVPLPETKPCNAGQLVVAKLWRVIMMQPDEGRGDVAVLPASLAACMCVDSTFIPSLIPEFQLSLNLPLAEIHMCHHLEYNGREIPTKLAQYQPVFDLVEEQNFAVLKLADVQLTGCHLAEFERKSVGKASLSASMDVIEYGHLSMMPVISPVHLSLAADLAASGQGHELDAQLQMGKLRVAIGKSVIHSLNMALAAWTNMGTEENIALHSRQMYAYGWRSHASAQMLHLCINKPSWKWTEPFPIDTVGTWVRCVHARDQDYVVIIKVTALTSVQKQVTISGQLLVSNQLSQPISVKVCTNHPSPSHSSPSPPPTTAATPSSFDLSHETSQHSPAITSFSQTAHHYVIQPGATLPSLVASEIHHHPIQFRLAGFNTAWSHEIYLSGDNMKDNHMVKIPLPDDTAYFHIWCRIFCQHFQGKDQKLVMLTPLYVVRTHLPRPLFIHLEMSKLKGSQELLTRSRGHEFQFHCMGGDVTHNMSFRLGSDKQLSSPPVVLSTGLIDQLERKPLEAINIDSLCSQKLNSMQHSWPYLSDASAGWNLDCQDDGKTSHIQKCSSNNVATMEPDDSEAQPSIDLNVALSEYIPGCDTLLVEVTPSCLVTNLTDLGLMLGEQAANGQADPGKQWMLRAGHTISPPLRGNHFILAVQQEGQTSSWKHIPLSDESKDYKRYNEDIGKVLFIDSHVPVSFQIISTSDHISEMVFLTVTSDFQHGIRTIYIQEQFCVSNRFKEALIVKLLALPLSTPKVNMCDTNATTATLPGKGQNSDREVIPLPTWSLVGKREGETEAKSEGKTKEDSFVFYVSVARGDGVQKPGSSENVSAWYWSQPVRINLTKGSQRMTTSLPGFHYCCSDGSQSSHASEGENQTSSFKCPATSQALCLSTYQNKGVTHLVVMEDAAPVIVLENLCPFALEFGQSVTTGNSNERAVQEQLELVSDLPWVPPGGWTHYTMPGVNAEYSNKETLSIPRMLFRVKAGFGQFAGIDTTETFEWSASVQIAGLDAFVRLQGVCDLKVKIEVIGMVTHLIIRPVSKAEITAKEIRSRLKTHESEVVRLESPASSSVQAGHSSGNTTHNSDSSETKDTAKSKPITESLVRFTETQAGLEMLKNQTWFKATVGFYCNSITIIVQDESSPGEMSEIFSLLMQDFYVASFPLSHNPAFVGSENCLAVCVSYAQLDNQQYGNGSYDFPVVFLPQDIEKDKSDFSDLSGKMSVMETLAVLRSKAIFYAQVVTFSDRVWNQSAIESVECSVQPFTLYIEDGFIYRLIEELETFAPSKLVVSTVSSSQLESIHAKLPPAAALHACMLSQPMRIKQLTINPIKMLLSVHASLKLFLASDQTPLNLAKFERIQVFSSTQRLLNSMTMHYASAAIFRAGIVVGSLEILGNPTGLVRSISTGVSDLVRLPYSGLTQGPVAFVGGVSRGVGSLFKNVSAGMITSVTNFASSVSRNMDRLSLDSSHKERQEQNRRNRPSGMSDGLIQGLTGFGLSLLGAVAGLADQPIRNLIATSGDQRSATATSAASGLVTGVGKGLVGMFTKPIGGAAELVSQTGQGILHGTGLGQMPVRVQSPTMLGRSSLPSSGYKYCVKLFSTLPSPTILLAVPALMSDVLGDKVRVILVLTSDVLVVVNVEEDSQQLTLSLSELECCCANSDGLAEDEKEEVLSSIKESTVDERGKFGDDGSDDKDDEDDVYEESSGEMGGYQAKVTIIWTDHYYTSSALEHTQNASKERVAAFIDSTQNLTAGLISPDGHAQSSPLAPVSGSLPDHCPGTDSPPIGQDTPLLRRSVSDSSQTDAGPTPNVPSRPIDSPQYDFSLNLHWKELFVATFNTAKHRLQGQGFSV